MTKRYAPATERNREPIAEVLRGLLPAQGTVLEIASGTGEHAVFLNDRFPALHWQPSDIDEGNLDSIRAWSAESSSGLIFPPLKLDMTWPNWPDLASTVTPAISAIFCANMIHIAPWEAAEGLFAGAARLLGAQAPLILYGPFMRQGRHTAPSNEAFDESLKTRDPAWGVRDLELEVAPLAARHGFDLRASHAMPANNLIVMFSKD